jgi:hypothetical protein
MDVGARAVQGGADIGADRSGAEDCDFHGGTPFGLRDPAEVGEKGVGEPGETEAGRLDERG